LFFGLRHSNIGCPTFASFAKVGTTDLAGTGARPHRP
jgi:hypothetical protein